MILCFFLAFNALMINLNRMNEFVCDGSFLLAGLVSCGRQWGLLQFMGHLACWKVDLSVLCLKSFTNLKKISCFVSSPMEMSLGKVPQRIPFNVEIM